MSGIHVMRVATKTGIAVVAGAAVAFGAMTAIGHAFNPQPDPPGFGLVTLVTGQSIRVNLVCSGHAAGRVPPGPCAADVMFHDAFGNTLASQRVELLPGQAASVPLTLGRDGGDPGGMQPCLIPSPENRGFLIPSAEVFSTDSGRTMLFINPAAARLSEFGTSPPEPIRGGR